MFKMFLKILKKIIVSILFIYAFNRMAVSLNLFIPMNVFTVLLVTLCGVPSIIMLVLYFSIFI